MTVQILDLRRWCFFLFPSFAAAVAWPMYLRLLSHAPVTHVSLFPYLLFSSVSRFVYCKLSLLLSRITFITRTMLLLSPLSCRACAASDLAALWRMSAATYSSLRTQTTTTYGSDQTPPTLTPAPGDAAVRISRVVT